MEVQENMVKKLHVSEIPGRTMTQNYCLVQAETYGIF
jgi:hypothetical protein